MLQQTQAGVRTIEKYRAFLKAFPTTAVLAKATVTEVYALWQGLGYNRRAKALRDSALLIEEKYNGKFPQTIPELLTLPGVGPYTAAAVYVFVYDKPAVLIETNIRTVFIHHLFKSKEGVTDAELLPAIEAVLDIEHPRDWYYALMDYGAALKKEVGNVSRRSRHYVRQVAFEGSDRQLRGKVLQTLFRRPGQSVHMLVASTGEQRGRVELQLKALLKEGLLKAEGSLYSLD